MARRPNTQATPAVTEVQVKPEPTPAKVRAVSNRMRNPHTGAIFNTSLPTDVIDLNGPDNAWTRAQIRAKVLEVV